MSDITEIQLHHLANVSISSKYGLIDKGFPVAYAKLAALGYLEKKNGGYIITTLGLETLKANRDRLFGKKRKKKQKEEYEEAYYEEP